MPTGSATSWPRTDGPMLRLSSNVLPDITIDLVGEQPMDADGLDLLHLIRPRISGTLPVVGAFHAAPYGLPIPGVGMLVFLGILGLALYGAVSLVRKVV